MNDGGFISKEKLQELADKARSGYILTEKELNALSPILHPYIEESFPYAYVFPVDPEKPVKIVFEGEPMKEEEIVNALYEKLKEICNENSKSD